MNSLHMNWPMDGGCTYHRILQPARFCGEAFKKYDWEVSVGEGLPPGHDIYWLHGLPSPFAITELVKAKRRSGSKIVWGLDDDWLSIPDWNPATPSDEAMANYEIMKSIADWIVCSTPQLASTLSSVSPKVLWAPNLLDLSLFPIPNYTTDSAGGRNYDIQVDIPVRVVWSGGNTHKNDLIEMEEAIHKVMENFTRDEVVVIYNGMMPPPKLLTKYLHKGLFHQPSVPFCQYQKVLNSITPSIYLAPLSPIEFNLSKSNLRIIEGWALMACPVASDWGEYKCVKEGKNGFLAWTPSDWYDGLSRLIKDHESRVKMAINGRQVVEREYDWNNPVCRAKWYEVFAKILGTPVPDLT